MPHINDRSDLEKYGINPLTGEACAYSMRILCDLNEDGAKIVAEFLGIKEDGFLPRWNPKVNDKPSVGSIMIPRELFKPLTTYILFRIEHARYVLISDSGQIGLNDEELKERPAYQESIDKGHFTKENGWELVRNWSGPEAENGRNRHGFSGRLD